MSANCTENRERGRVQSGLVHPARAAEQLDSSPGSAPGSLRRLSVEPKPLSPGRLNFLICKRMKLD